MSTGPRVEKELTPRMVQRLLHDAVILAAAVTLYVPASERRPHRSATRVLRALMPGTMRVMTAANRRKRR